MNKELCFKIDSKELMLEQSLVEYNDIPIYFICKDTEQNYYTVLCVDIDEEQYIIVETRLEKIFKLLMQKITMRDLILSEDKFWKVKAGNTIEEDNCIQEDMSSICLKDLPYEKSYFKIAAKVHYDFLENIKSLLFSQPEEWTEIETNTAFNPDELNIQIKIENITVDDYVGILDVKVNNSVLNTEKKCAKYTETFSDLKITTIVHRNNHLKNHTITTSKSASIAA